MNLGTSTFLAHGSMTARWCNRSSFLCKTSHNMEKPIASGSPQPAWAAAFLHDIEICTKKSHKACRREGDKCFFDEVFLS